MIYKTNSGYGVNFNQLIQNGNFENTDYWSVTNCDTSVSNGVGKFTARTTNTGNLFKQFSGVVIGHKYFLSVYAYNSSGHFGIGRLDSYYGSFPVSTSEFTHISGIYTGVNGSPHIFPFGTTGSVSVGAESYVKKFCLIDLTQMFGSGNEPTTVAEFREMYSNDYYGYTLSNWQWARKGKVTSYPTPVIENGITLLPIENHIVGVVKPELSDISLLKLKTGSYKNTHNQGPYVEVKEGNEIVINTPSENALYGVIVLPMTNVTLKAGHTYYFYVKREKRAGDWNSVTLDPGYVNYFLVNDPVITITVDTDKVLTSARVYLNNTSTHYDNYSVKLIITENRKYLIDKGIISQ